MSSPRRIWTVGHSTLAAQDFLALLGAHEIQAIADVRRFPASKRYPHFNASELRSLLRGSDISYVGLPALGGRRRPLPDSPNTGWRNDSFRGYADHMTSDEFAGGLEELVGLAVRMRTAIMCAEAVWWRCHRGLIADALKVRGWDVTHILSATSVTEHPYTPPARVVNGRLSYAEDQLPLGDG